MKRVLHDLAAFFKGHWPHFVAAIPAAIAFTALHELAHCAAVWIQGGNVTDFAWLPSAAGWGHMSYLFPQGVQYSRRAIMLAPYAFWAGSCLLAGALASRRAPWPFWAASTIFVWLFIVPLADIANTAIPYVLWNTFNDFHRAFGPVGLSFSVLAVVLGLLASWYGYLLNRRLYRDRAVGLPAYCVLAVLAALVVLAGTSVVFG